VSAGTVTAKPTFEPGVDVLAKVTIFCDGVRGNLTKELLRRLPLEPAVSRSSSRSVEGAVGGAAGRVAPGTVMHTMGYPLRFEEFGGGFIYAMPDGQLSLGFVVGSTITIRSSTRTWHSTASSSTR
jgi:electron-transferring-flavoprotein dehydrogenase